jgi:twitching motility two-component system response regulator PilG
MSKRVLIVDDSKTIRDVARSHLKGDEFDVELVEDGFDCLPAVMVFDPDIIFLDVMMPRLDGYETCSILKSNPRLKGIAVVMISSKDGLFDLARGRMAGVDAHLNKPFSKDDLINAVRSYARK